MSLRPSCATERCPGDPGRKCKALLQKEKSKQRDFEPNKSRISNWRVYLTMKHSGMAHLPPSRFDLGDEGKLPMLQCYKAQSDWYYIVPGHLDPPQGKSWGDLISEFKRFSFMNVVLKAEQNWGDCDNTNLFSGMLRLTWGSQYTYDMEAAFFHDHTRLRKKGRQALTERHSCCWPVSSVFVFCISGINYVNQLQWTSVPSSKLFLLRWKGEIETSKENKLNLVCLFQQNMFFLVLVQNVL